MRILLVEDYAPLADSICTAVREAGWACDRSGDGEEAVAFAESSRYDAIILDLMLPKLDGLSVLRALIRRRYQGASPTLRVADLLIDTAGRTVQRAGKPVHLSAREYAVLEYLASRRGQVVTRAEIWDHCYDFASEPSSNVVDVYIGYLRRKVDQGHALRLIHTRRGQGYLLSEEQ